LGYGTVIGGVYFVMILLLSCYVYADSMNRMSAISWKSLEVASDIQYERLKSGIFISQVQVQHGHNPLYLDAINDGTITISRADFSRIDVILTFTDNATSLTTANWCYYNSSDASRCRWRLDPSLPSNPHPSAVNPLDWDPSETLSLVIEIPASNEFKDKSSGYVKVALPQGASNGLTFVVQ
jgi:hypothetical protein